MSHEERERALDLRLGGEEFGGLLERHVHDVADAVLVVDHFERGRVVAAAVAVRARHVARRQEIHLDLDHALARAGFAAAAFGVEGKAARRVAAHPRERQLREERADFVEDLDVGRGRRARGLADGRLIDLVARPR